MLRWGVVTLRLVGGCLPLQESLFVLHISCVIHPVTVHVSVYVCHLGGRERESNLGHIQYKSCFLIDKALFSPMTTTAAISALAHLSQRANEEDSGSTHICFRSKAICCKCVCEMGVSKYLSEWADQNKE